MSYILNWLDQHSGSVTALATIGLAILTAVYVRATAKIAKSAGQQAQLLADSIRLPEHEAARALLASASRLIAVLEALPKQIPTDYAQLQQGEEVGSWTEHDLHDLLQWAQRLRGPPLDHVLQAVHHLRQFQPLLVNARGDPGPGYMHWSPAEERAWGIHRDGSIGALKALRTTLPGRD